MGKRSRIRRRGPRSTTTNVVSMPVHIQPVQSLQLVVSLVGATARSVTIGTEYSNFPWRVTSVDLSMCSTTPCTITVNLYGGVLASGTSGIAEVTTATRPLTVSVTQVQVKVRNSKHVQHVITGGVETPVLSLAVNPTNANIVVTGLINMSIRGAISP